MVVVGLARWSCLVWVVARWGVREPSLFHVAAARARSPTFSGRTADFDLTRYLGYKFECYVFRVVFLSHGGFPLS